MKDSVLFNGIRIGNLEVKNRFVMPAMNSHTTQDNCYLDRGVAYYSERAKGGYGLCITEFVAVDPNGLGSLKEPGIWDDSFIPSLKKLTDSIHQNSGLIFAQLHHAGMIGKSFNPDFKPKAPSSVINEKGEKFEAYTIEDIKKIVDEFIQGAKRAKIAGFDGVEIHGAHGYLITQFLSRKTNHRIDDYGGNYENRFRIAKEIIQGIKNECGVNFPISFRINAVDGNNPEDNQVIDNAIFAKMAEEAGADVLNISSGTVIGTYFEEPGYNLENTRLIKKGLNVPVIAVGRMNNEHVAKWAIESGAADLIAFGRQSICDPHFPEKVYHNQSNLVFHCLGCMQRCSPDIGCESDDVGVSCMINPFSGKELRWKLTKTEEPKDIAVIGGGCAGLQFAWVAAARGHHVTLYEKESHEGGNLISASQPDKKKGFLQTIITEKQHCLKYGVKFKYGNKVTKQSSLDEEIVVNCTGSHPLISNIQNVENLPVAEDVLLDRIYLKNKRIAILGGGSVGLETAEYLLKNNNRIDVYEMKNELAGDMSPIIKKELLMRLNGKINTFLNTEVEKITENKQLRILHQDKESLTASYDEIILAFGYQSNESLNFDNKIVYSIGDSKKTRTVKEAVYEATKLAISI